MSVLVDGEIGLWISITKPYPFSVQIESKFEYKLNLGVSISNGKTTFLPDKKRKRLWLSIATW